MKGIPHQKNQWVKSHILDSNGVWYSLFWSEGPQNHQNLNIFVSKFVAWNLRHRPRGLIFASPPYINNLILSGQI